MDNCSICGAPLRSGEAVRCKTCKQNLQEGLIQPSPPPTKKTAEVKSVERAVFTPPQKVRQKR